MSESKEQALRLFDRFKRGEMRLTRIEAFSDGVFAIVVTLLVLELQAYIVRTLIKPERPPSRIRISSSRT